MCVYLLRVPFRVREHRGHVEHDLLVVKVGVERLGPRLPMRHIQPSAETRWKHGNVSPFPFLP